MPQCHYLHLSTTNTIVEVVVNPSQVQASNASQANVQSRCAYAGFEPEKRKRILKFLVKSVWSKRAVLVPPQRGAINPRLRSPGDLNIHGYSAVALGELRDHLRGGHGLSAIRLGNRQQQFSLLLSRQVEAAFIVFCQNGHRCALLEVDSFDHDFSVDYFSSGYLHNGKGYSELQRLCLGKQIAGVASK